VAEATATRAFRVAVVGAECTGKTRLVEALHAHLLGQGRWRVAFVPEWLRAWCEQQGRTPQAGEQAAIAQEQHRRIEAAAAAHDIVLSDTTALMTAVYSQHIFDDDSLVAQAVAWHRQMDVTLLTALDLPWQADGIQRDGAHVRAPVDARLRALLTAHQLPFAVVAGAGAQRVQQALRALERPMAAWALRAGAKPTAQADAPGAPTVPASDGLFGRLMAPRSASGHVGDSAAEGATPASGAARLRPVRGYSCECCVPEAERASLALLRQAAD
jgi:nicotinamide riboside kinase